MSFGEGKGFVYCHIHNGDGRYSPKIKITDDPKQVASFIIKTRDCPVIKITNSSDLLELQTMDGGFVDFCKDQEYLKDRLLPVLIPMQTEGVEPEDINILDWGVAENNNNNSVMIPFIKDNFNVELP